MKKFQDWMEKYMGPVMAKMTASRNMNAVSRGFSNILPITIIGSLATLFLYFNYFGFQDFLANAGIKPYINLIVNLTTNAISVYLVFSVAFNKARFMFDETEARIAALLAEMAFLLLIPMTDGNVTLSWLGSQGLFTALLCGLIVPSLYHFLNSKGVIIRLPESVPPFIADSFKAILPAFLIAVLCCGLDAVLKVVGLNSVPQAVMALLGKPFEALSNNVFTLVILSIAVQLFWFFGIHGMMTLGSIQRLIFVQATMENIAAAAEGGELPNILTTGFNTLFSTAGMWLACCVVLMFMVKREDLRTMGRLSFFPAIFNITEPLRFGLPLVLNPILFIPQVFLQGLNVFLTYIVVSLGLVSRPRIEAVFGLPFLLDSFSMGGISAVIWTLIMFAMDIIVWIPFIKMLEVEKNREDAQITQAD